MEILEKKKEDISKGKRHIERTPQAPVKLIEWILFTPKQARRTRDMYVYEAESVTKFQLLAKNNEKKQSRHQFRLRYCKLDVSSSAREPCSHSISYASLYARLFRAIAFIKINRFDTFERLCASMSVQWIERASTSEREVCLPSQFKLVKLGRVPVGYHRLDLHPSGTNDRKTAYITPELCCLCGGSESESPQHYSVPVKRVNAQMA